MPTLGVTAQHANTPPVVEGALDWDQDDEVRIFRRDTDRSRPVRGLEPVKVTGGQTLIFYDHEAPFGVPVVYEATSATAHTVSASTTLNPTAWYPNDLEWSTERGAVWLRHLSIPQLSMPIDLSNADSPEFRQSRAVVEPLNRRTPIVLTDSKRKAATTTLDVRTWSLEEAARLRELLSDNSVLLLTVPAAERWGLTSHYVAVGDVSEERLIQEWAPFEGRVFHLPCEIVDRPAGGVVYPDCCYWSVQRGVVSYLDLAERYASYATLASCVTGEDPDGGGPVEVFRTTQTTYGGDFYGLKRTLLTHVILEAGRQYRPLANITLSQATAPVTTRVRYEPGTLTEGEGTGPVVGEYTDSFNFGADPWNQMVGPVNTFTVPETGHYTMYLELTSDAMARDETSDDVPRWLALYRIS